LPLRREKCCRLLIEGNEGFPAKPIAFVGNDAIGKVSARIERQQASLPGRPVHFHIRDGQQRPDRAGRVGLLEAVDTQQRSNKFA